MEKTLKVKAPKLKRAIKNAGWIAILESVLLGILGLIIAINPEETLNTVLWILGLGLIIIGVWQVLSFFFTGGLKDAGNNSLLAGTVALLFGVITLTMGTELTGLFRIILAIWIIYTSLVRVSSALKLRAAGVSAWGYVLFAAALVMFIGLFILLNTGAVMYLIGWAMLISAILGLVDDIIFMRHIDKVLA